MGENNKTNTICLNSVKFFAACIVAFIWHYQHFQPIQGGGQPFDSIFVFSYQYGWLMVELFFMLSGFGMMIGYSSKVLNHEISFVEYLKKRIHKIYPLFFVSLILVIIVEIIYRLKMGNTFVYGSFDMYHLMLNVILCQDGLFGMGKSFNAPSWCVSICFILYVIFFLVFYFSKNSRTAIYKFASLGIIGVIILNLGWRGPVMNTYVARGLLCFSIGIILAYCYQNEHLFRTRNLGYMSLLFLAFVYLMFRRIPQIIGDMQMLFILFIAPIIIICVIYVPWINKLLSTRLATYFGSLSMEIYLFHFIVQCAIKDIDIYFNLQLNYSSHIVWIVYAVSTIVVSIIYKQFLSKKITGLFIKICDGLLLNKTKN